MTGGTQAAPDDYPHGWGLRVVQRTVMRPDQDFDVAPLYLSGLSRLSAGEASSTSRDDEEKNKPAAEESEASEGLSSFGRVTETGSTFVEPQRRVTFGTYFNAFPASYWRRWTDFETVRLVARLKGEGSLVVYRSTAKGHVVRAESVTVDSPEGRTVTIDLPLKPFIDGGWYWFDLAAGHQELVLEEAVWGFVTDRIASGRVTIGITTFNRPDFCVAQLANLSNDPAVLDILDEVIVVDQGTQKVVDDPQYAPAAAALGDKLRVIEQPNLGGSGGFSRAMFEASSRGASDYVLLLDDDVVCELEGVLRGVAFADLAKQPLLVGGQMLSLYDRSVMHAYGEAISKWTWFWGPAPATVHGHNFARKSLRSTSWLHRRIDVDYNGWWMCLIPTQVIREIGLSVPMFIKWDDAEFGLRAGAAGFPTVTLPGVAVWHVPWSEKDDTLDWQAYFHQRNRLVSALLHSPYERGGRLVLESLENHVKRIMSMQYGTGEIIMRALEDVLDGPERMHRDIAHRLAEVNAMRKKYLDGTARPAIDEYPAPRRAKPPRRGKGIGMPSSAFGKAKMAVLGLVRQVTPVRDLARDFPEGVVPHVDQRWYRLAHFDSAVVSSADGMSASLYQRDPAEFREQVARSVRLHARLFQEWPELSRRYREALPAVVSPEEWSKTFSGSTDEAR